MRAAALFAVFGLHAAAQVLPAPKLPVPETPWLRLEDVLASTAKHYPPLLIALQDRVIADADVTIAEGRFDLGLTGGFDGDYLTQYANNKYSAGVEQATQFQGMSYFAGWRLGRGEFASYDGKLQTDSAGEYRAGVRLPTLRDRALDPRRADLYKALLGRRIAELGVDQQRLVITQLATRRYWDWVAAGRRFQVAQSVLKIALDRDTQLKDAVKLGAIPAIEVTDNQRAILARRAAVVEGDRALQLAAIELSFFHRDPGGQPLLPESRQLPPAFPAIRAFEEQRLADDIDLALKRRPEIRRFAAQRDQVEIDRKLAQNQLLPNVDLVMQYTREGGDRIVQRGPDELSAALLFNFPIQRRQAKGRETSALARIAQFDQRERFAREQVAAEVRDAYSAVIAAYRRAQVLREEVEVTRQLEDAERVKFELGDSTLFLLNLREQQTFDAALREVSVLNEYFRALALYDQAVAETLPIK